MRSCQIVSSVSLHQNNRDIIFLWIFLYLWWLQLSLSYLLLILLFYLCHALISKIECPYNSIITVCDRNSAASYEIIMMSQWGTMPLCERLAISKIHGDFLLLLRRKAILIDKKYHMPFMCNKYLSTTCYAHLLFLFDPICLLS